MQAERAQLTDEERPRGPKQKARGEGMPRALRLIELRGRNQFAKRGNQASPCEEARDGIRDSRSWGSPLARSKDNSCRKCRVSPTLSDSLPPWPKTRLTTHACRISRSK